jgi:hypothetical protein
MDHLSASSLARHGLLEPNAIQALLRRYYGGEKGLASRIWNLVTFQAWWESYVGAYSGDAGAGPLSPREFA